MPNPNQFRYTLAPLLQDGRHCLFCQDIGKIQSVALERVEFYFPGSPWQRIVRQSDDIFSLIEQELIRWPALERISAARFCVQLQGEPRTYPLIVRTSGRFLRAPQETIGVIDEWLKKRSFLEKLAE